MIRRFRTETFINSHRLEAWLNEMAEFAENAPARRHHATRQLKIESITISPEEGGNLILAVISRLEDDDES